ncbi:MAG: hypothetical protein SGI84_11585 [Gemmatimonadota bacterium]|nr:hypothetical protein [Gemmatimonadota bacterium]
MPFSLSTIRLLSVIIILLGVGMQKLQATTVPEGGTLCQFCSNVCQDVYTFCAAQNCELNGERCVVDDCEGESGKGYSTWTICNEDES